LESKAHLEEQVSQLRSALAKARRDLQGTRAGERRARHSAEHDSLTQLPNRRHFEACLQGALTEQISTRKGLALFFLDLDDFEQVNDTHGHAAGDRLLRVVAGAPEPGGAQKTAACLIWVVTSLPACCAA